VAGTVILYFVSPILAGRLLKHFPELSEAQKTSAFFAAGVLSICATIGGIGFRIWYAEHRGYVANLFVLLGAVGGLIGVLVVNRLPPEHRLLLSLSAYLAPGALLALIALFWGIGKHRTNGITLDKFVVARIARRAWRFWVVAILSALVLQVDVLVISQLLLAKDVATYSLVAKIFALIFFGYSAMLGSLWPVFAEARAAGHWDNISQIARRYLVSGVAFMAVATLCLVGAMPWIVRILAPHSGIVVSATLILLMGIYYAIRVWTDMYTTILQCGNDVRVFWLYVPLQAIVGVSLQWVLASHYGLHGIVLGLIGSFALTAAWVLPLAVSHSRRTQSASQRRIFE
jgi:O-antigen/teichoic acid export membrane protein